MSKIYVYGYLDSGTESFVSGGFTLVATDGSVIAHEDLTEPCLTELEAHLHGLLRAVDMAGDEVMVLSSSNVAISDMNRGQSESCPHLSEDIQRARMWRPRNIFGSSLYRRRRIWPGCATTGSPRSKPPRRTPTLRRSLNRSGRRRCLVWARLAAFKSAAMRTHPS